MRQMFGQPATGKTLEMVSKKSKIHRADLNTAKKFLAVYDSPTVKAAVGRWVKSFKNAHPKQKVEYAGNLKAFKLDTFYIVFLEFDNRLAQFGPVELVTD